MTCVLSPPNSAGIFCPQPFGNIIGFVRAVQHQKQNRFLLERFELFAVFAPSFDARRKICSVSHTCMSDLASSNLCHALYWSLHDSIDDRLFERIIRDRPGENRTLLKAWRCGKIQLRSDWCLPVQSANDIVPFALFIVRVVGFVVYDHQFAQTASRSGPRSQSIPAFSLAAWIRASRSFPRARLR